MLETRIRRADMAPSLDGRELLVMPAISQTKSPKNSQCSLGKMSGKDHLVQVVQCQLHRTLCTTGGNVWKVKWSNHKTPGVF